jgi:hypothetical protein
VQDAKGDEQTAKADAGGYQPVELGTEEEIPRVIRGF